MGWGRRSASPWPPCSPSGSPATPPWRASCRPSRCSGSAGAAYLLARVMGRRGRRPGLALGYLMGAVGAGLCVVGGAVGSFVAAADRCPPARLEHRRVAGVALRRRRPRAAAAQGPRALAGAVGDHGRCGGRAQPGGTRRLPWPSGSACRCSPARSWSAWWRRWPPRSSSLALLRPDPLLLAREVSGEDPGTRRSGSRAPSGPSLLRAHPGIPAAVLALASAHAVMVAVMVMTPLHMDHGGAALRGDRPGHQHPRARDVLLLPGRRTPRRPARAASRPGSRRGGAVGRAGVERDLARGCLDAHRGRPLPPRPGLVVAARSPVRRC